MSLWTLNGDRMLEQNVCAEGDELITSCAFFEGSGSEYLKRTLLFVGHKMGVVNVSQHEVLHIVYSWKLPGMGCHHCRRLLCLGACETNASPRPRRIQHWGNYHLDFANGAKSIYGR